MIAAGGLETTRLLLAARAARAAPLDIASDLARPRLYGPSQRHGRRDQLHSAPDQISYGYERSPDGVYCRRRFWITPPVQRELGLLNIMFRLHHPPINDPAHREPVLSAMYLVKDLLLYEYSRKNAPGPLARPSAGPCPQRRRPAVGAGALRGSIGSTAACCAAGGCPRSRSIRRPAATPSSSTPSSRRIRQAGCPWAARPIASACRSW
ncbi:MAG: hypothetical protein WDO24_23725 [Pseudomonadota bacterium]